ncbi:alpha/beta fold hydrolase [Fimbriiglobus ruber]|uniref:Putative hydrolase n=1 Tax=Fimbriiglobus ruber TaxID=1908690 RepID=A0A225DCR4_9BACT|nr:alpha/beta hydrolase [Fimbriiglobus ruber]OWK39370.1 putative hydrolase [Fimbriiglobus ruber]
MPDLMANGIRLFYQQSGDGPDVVLVHAVTSNQAVWVFSGLSDALASDGFRVTTYDLRGHGMSDRPSAGYTSAVMAEDLRALHAALGLAPAFVIGHSFGGVVGLNTALLYPACVRGVMLSDSFFPGLRHIEPNFGRSNVWLDLRETFRKVGVDLGETVDFTRLFRTAAVLSPDKTKELEGIVGVLGRGWLRQLPRLAETTCGNEVLAEAGLTAERIASVSCPVVALYDEFSPFLATSSWLERHLPQCTAEIIPAAKHLAVVENTAAFTDAVRRHLRRLADR